MNTQDAERRNRVLTAALTHDLAEARYGDLPAPAKRELGKEWSRQFSSVEHTALQSYGLVVDLPPRDVRGLKLADYIDGCLFCIEERRMGNRAVVPIF